MKDNLNPQKMSLLRGGDIFLFLTLLYIPFFFWGEKNLSGSEKILIYHFDSLVSEISLNFDTTIFVAEVKIEVKDKKCNVISSSCPSQICVHSYPVKNGGDQIVCVPNGVTIQIVENGGVDAVAQ